MANRLMRFVGGPWDGQTKNSGDVHISEGRVIVRQSWVPPLDFGVLARGEAKPSMEYKIIQTEYALWSDDTWRVKAISDPVVGRTEYDVPPDLKEETP